MPMKKIATTVVSLSALCIPGIGLSSPESAPGPAASECRVPPAAASSTANGAKAPTAGDQGRPPHLQSPDGVSISIGGGVMDFTDERAREISGGAGTWEVRVASGTRKPIAVEVAYVGSARSLDAVGLDDDAIFVGFSFEGATRLNVIPSGGVQPYLLAGLGVTRWSVSSEGDNMSDIQDRDISAHIPLGGGLGFRQGGFVLDLRGTLRATLGDALTSSARSERTSDPFDDEQVRAHTWQASINIGWEL